MGDKQETLSLKNALFSLKELFKSKGYPENLFLENQPISFSYNTLNFTLEIPLIIKENQQVYFLVDYKPQERLSFFERGILALARLFFSPLPYFGLVTNLKTFALIDLYEFKVTKGTADLIPDYQSLLLYQPSQPKAFKPELEKKILAIYLSGG
jgi:hypothetical protein